MMGTRVTNPLQSEMVVRRWKSGDDFVQEEQKEEMKEEGSREQVDSKIAQLVANVGVCTCCVSWKSDIAIASNSTQPTF